MKIKLISHASVVISCTDCKIWTDPWLEGKAFNNAWSLHPKPEFSEAWLDEIDYLWVSHEHPDHFHIQTLKNLPASFKERVTILFQERNTDKMPNAFKWLGFKNIKLLKHATLTKLTNETNVFVYQIGMLDSSFGVKNNGISVFNLNDCEPSANDYKVIQKRFDDAPDILLNQFSLAGNNGALHETYKIRDKAKGILNKMIEDHKKFNAHTTIPFASFMYFSSTTNKYMNQFHNSIDDVISKFAENDLSLKVLYMNDELDVNHINKYDDTKAIKRYRKELTSYDALKYDSYEEIPFSKLRVSFEKRREQLLSCYPKYILSKLAEMTAFVSDSGYGLTFSMASGQFEINTEITKENADLVIDSQPLDQAFSTTWGVQTLGVAAQYFINNNQGTWRWYRIITNLNNSEIYLKRKYLMSKKLIDYILQRLKGNGLSQVIYRLKKI